MPRKGSSNAAQRPQAIGSGDPWRPATVADARAQGLSDYEFSVICGRLHRVPNLTELAIYAVMWSEHCSYKNSILELKTLPRTGGRLLAQAGEENAGLVDIGDGWAVAFKIESHNHPSAVEPFQGAATGVGGILRDIFTMGARPLACLDSLRFGLLSDPRTRYLFDGVVRGIAHYGNCFGVPTVAGEVNFAEGYSGNPLVNVMAVGVVKTDLICRNKATGKGNPVFYVGARTGRDGIHGATFASEELSADNESKRPAVQVGDPFAEKLLLEATLELARSGALVAIQDMGAAGLSCSSSEMSAAGGVGMDLNLDLVPRREPDMEPWEIMLSESQERMLLVAEKGKEDTVRDIFAKWELNAVPIGVVTDDGMLRLRSRGRVVAEIPADTLVLGKGAPQYKREWRKPKGLAELQRFDPTTLPEPSDPAEVLLKLMSHPDIASKRWVYEQYDHSVRSNTVVEPGCGDATVIRVEGTSKGLAVKTDGNGRKVYLNPRRGAELAVVEAALNVACTGARPVAVTNCLNFGHPYKPEVYYYFHEAVAGMGCACRALGTPVSGGNVSFYNETDGTPVLPTPVIGMLGVMDDVSKFVTAPFKQAGDLVYLLGGAEEPGLGGSLYLDMVYGLCAGNPPPVNYSAHRRIIELLVSLAEAGAVRSAHDVSDGGIAVALAECCVLDLRNPLGTVVDFPKGESDTLISHLFGEAPGRVVVSVQPDKCVTLELMAALCDVPCRRLGVVGGSYFVWKEHFAVPVTELESAYYHAIPAALGEED